MLSRSTPCPFSHYSRTYGVSLEPVEVKHRDVPCPALSNLLCRSTSVVLRKPFQASFFLQPAHQGAPCAAQSTIYWHGFAEGAGDTVPLLRPSPGRVVTVLPVTSGYWGYTFSSQVRFPYTQHTVTTISGEGSSVVPSLFVLRTVSPLQNWTPPADSLSGCLR